jgi:hypothetical protein
MPYGSRQPGRPTLHVDLGAPTLTRPGAARSDGAQITRNSFAWVQMEHRHNRFETMDFSVRIAKKPTTRQAVLARDLR